MNDSSASTNAAEVDDDRDAALEEIKTDVTGGADKEWPDEAKIVPDTYLGDDSK